MAKYFTDKLNYSLANEDIELEANICKKLKPKVIGSICGAGPRGLYLLPQGGCELDLFDVSPIQIEWARAYEKAIKELDEVSFLRAYHDDSSILKSIGVNVGLNEILESNEVAALAGSWEKTFLKFSKLAQKILGRKILRQLKNCQSLDEQKYIITSTSFSVRWTVVLAIVGNKSMMNSLLYSGDFIKKNLKESYVKFYRSRFARLFSTTLVKDNFFLSLCLFGEVTLTNTPLRCRSFNGLQTSVKDSEIKYHMGDIVSTLSNGEKQYDYFSYSDVPSYFDDGLGNDFIQKAKPSIKVGGVICVRYYLRVFKPDLAGFEDITEQFSSEISKEKVGVYNIKFYRRIA